MLIIQTFFLDQTTMIELISIQSDVIDGVDFEGELTITADRFRPIPFIKAIRFGDAESNAFIGNLLRLAIMHMNRIYAVDLTGYTSERIPEELINYISTLTAIPREQLTDLTRFTLKPIGSMLTDPILYQVLIIATMQTMTQDGLSRERVVDIAKCIARGIRGYWIDLLLFVDADLCAYRSICPCPSYTVQVNGSTNIESEPFIAIDDVVYDIKSRLDVNEADMRRRAHAMTFGYARSTGRRARYVMIDLLASEFVEVYLK